MARYLRLFLVQLRTSMLLTLQYRFDFFLDALTEAFWTTTALVPLFVVYEAQSRATIAGFSFPEALLVVGFFTVLQGVLEGAIAPSLGQVVEQVRKGTLDFVLLKPASAQFLVSTSRFLPFRAVNVLVGLGVFVFAFHRLGRAPTVSAVALASLLLLCAVAILYSFWIFAVSLAFVVVRVDNLTYLFSSVFDAARWPSSVFRGPLKLLFTFVIPLAVLTTFPAEALLGRLDRARAIAAVMLAATMLILSRAVFRRAIARYTSASG